MSTVPVHKGHPESVQTITGQAEKATQLFAFPLASRGEFPERPLAGHQVVVCPFFSNTSIVNDKYAIRHLHNWQLMSDNNRRPADLDFFYGRHNGLLVFDVQGGGTLIEDKDTRAAHQCTSNLDPLRLPAGD